MAERLLIDLSGTLDANGNGAFSPNEPAYDWQAVTVSIQENTYTTSAKWGVYIGQKAGAQSLLHIMDFGIGQGIRSGPFLIAPSEILVVQCTGGIANDGVKGTIYGGQDVDPEDVPIPTIATASVSITSQVQNDVSDRMYRLLGMAIGGDYLVAPNASYQGTFAPPSTGIAAGVVTAPAAGATIAATGTLARGVYRVRVAVAYGATGDGAANMLFKTTELTGTRIPHGGGANMTSPEYVYERILSTVGLTVFSVVANAAGAAGSIYIARITYTALNDFTPGG